MDFLLAMAAHSRSALRRPQPHPDRARFRAELDFIPHLSISASSFPVFVPFDAPNWA
jgi:hypothetical protein